MESNRHIAHIRQLLTEGKTRSALDQLATSAQFQQHSRTITLLQAELTGLQEKELKGIIDPKDARLAYNQLNDRILELLELPAGASSSLPKRRIWLVVLGALLLISALLIWKFNRTAISTCPAFDTNKSNRVLLLPFQNVGSAPSKPVIILRDRIDQLANKNNLSVSAKIGSLPHELADRQEVTRLAKSCEADLIVWGQYSSRQDSIFLNLQYHFPKAVEWSDSESLRLRDVTVLQNGSMLKGLDDAIFSLCGLLAMRANDKALTKKWIDKVGKKEEADELMLEWANSGVN